jgi:hypothetical protein
VRGTSSTSQAPVPEATPKNYFELGLPVSPALEHRGGGQKAHIGSRHMLKAVSGIALLCRISMFTGKRLAKIQALNGLLDIRRTGRKNKQPGVS